MDRLSPPRHTAHAATRRLPAVTWLLGAAVLLGAASLLGCDTKTTPPAKDTSTTADNDARNEDGAASDAGCADDSGCDDTAAAAVCTDGDPASAAACVDQAGYLKDLTFIAAPRPTGSAHHAAVRKMLVERLTALKFKVTEQSYGIGTNVIGERVGTAKADEIVIIGGHYDGVPKCPAADDNGTGVAGALQAAAALARYDHARTLQIVFWDEEERGLTGSFHHAVQLAKAGRSVVAVMDYEMIGFASKKPDTQALPAGFDVIFAEAGKYWWANKKAGDFIAVIFGDKSKAAAEAFIAASVKLGVPALPVELSAEFMESSTFADLRRSDHTSYWAEGYPGIMITDTANFRNTHYHCTGGSDTVDRLDHSFALGIVKATVTAVVGLLKADGGKAVAPEVPVCSLDNQDCAAGKKCTPWAEGQRWMPTCMPVFDKPAGLYAACTRTKNKLGDDTCGAGLFCSPWGVVPVTPTTRHCLRPCATKAVCAKDEACVAMGRRIYGGSVAPHNVGLCLKACDPFAATSCGAGLMCAGGFVDTEKLRDTHTCMALGKIGEGAACQPMSWGQCTAGLDCIYGPTSEAAACRAPCDATHACTAGTCVMDPYSATPGLGHCLP